MSFDTRTLVYKMSTRPSVAMAIKGPPGVGKTAQAKQAAEDLGIPCMVFLASSCDETDIAGMPVLRNGAMTYVSQQWALDFGKQRGLLIFDEYNCARPEVTNAMLTLIQNRTLPNGRDKLHPHTMILALMNDAAMVGNEELSPAMNNRFGWVEVGMPTPQEHLKWITTGESQKDMSAKSRKQLIDGLPQPITIEEWEAWMWSDASHGAELKELYRRAIAHGLKFAKDDDFLTSCKICTPRTVEKLLYFAGSVDNVPKWAGNFLDPQNAQIFKTVGNEMKRAAANVAFKNSGRGVYGSDDPEHVANAEAVEEQIKTRNEHVAKATQDVFGKVLGDITDEDQPDTFLTGGAEHPEDDKS